VHARLPGTGGSKVKKTVIVAVMAAIVVASIVIIYDAVVRNEPASAGCQASQPNCIDVKVIPVGGTPVIQPIPVLKVSAAAVITWKIVTDGYTFAGGGIDFYTITKQGHVATPAGEFHHCQVIANGRAFQCEDAHQHSEPTGYGYTVTLQGSPAVAPLDPFVVNN